MQVRPDVLWFKYPASRADGQLYLTRSNKLAFVKEQLMIL